MHGEDAQFIEPHRPSSFNKTAALIKPLVFPSSLMNCFFIRHIEFIVWVIKMVPKITTSLHWGARKPSCPGAHWLLERASDQKLGVKTVTKVMAEALLLHVGRLLASAKRRAVPALFSHFCCSPAEHQPTLCCSLHGQPGPRCPARRFPKSVSAPTSPPLSLTFTVRRRQRGVVSSTDTKQLKTGAHTESYARLRCTIVHSPPRPRAVDRGMSEHLHSVYLHSPERSSDVL